MTALNNAGKWKMNSSKTGSKTAHAVLWIKNADIEMMINTMVVLRQELGSMEPNICTSENLSRRRIKGSGLFRLQKTAQGYVLPGIVR